MVVLKTLLIFLIIFIYETVEYLLIFHNYYVLLGGYLTCHYTYRGRASLYLSEQSNFFYEKRPLEKKRVCYGNYFYLSAKIKKRFRKPHTYLKIIHDCVRSNFYHEKKTNITKTLILRIPNQFIGKDKWPKSLYFMGTIDLAILNRYNGSFSRRKTV